MWLCWPFWIRTRILNPDPRIRLNSTRALPEIHCRLRPTVIGQDITKTAGVLLEKIGVEKLMLDTRKTALKVVFAHS